MNDDTPRRRKADKWIPLIAVLGIVVLLVSAVFSTVAIMGVSKAEDAAQTAQDASNAAAKAAEAARENTATLDDLCLLATQQRGEIELSVKATKQYLSSPVSDSVPGFSAYIRQVSLPQAQRRLNDFIVPEGCK